MALRASARSMSRMFSGTARSSAVEKLPFEKPLFDSEILRKARQEHIALKRLQFYGNVAVFLVGASALARVGYYIAYGKAGGAQPLPKRS